MSEADPLMVRHRLDVDDYHRMGAAGILTEDDRVELIEGELIEMAPIGPDHMFSVIGLNKTLVLAFGDSGLVSVQNPVRLDRHSEPQPDFVVFHPRVGNYRRGAVPLPGDVLLLVEVSNSSLRYDRLVKLPLYARAGIPEVWIVDLQRRTVEVHRRPSGEAYTETATYGPGDTVTPELAPEIPVALARLFD